MNTNAFSLRRLQALCLKESRQILRDPSSLLICFVIPLLLLFIFGYGINFDSAALRVGLVLHEQGPQARRLADVFQASPYFDVTVGDNREEMVTLMQAGRLRGIVVVPMDFSRRLAVGEAPVVQVITDGSEPNTANFVHAFVNGAVQVWREHGARDAGLGNGLSVGTASGGTASGGAGVRIEPRFWFNQDAVSRNFIIPGAVSIIITVIGAILTSLVIAREWERGTMEALLSTRIRRAELLLSKFLPYYVLGMLALAVCMAVSLLLFRVPFRGSWLVLWGVSSLFLLNTLGMGLLVSTLMRNQFNAAQAALNAAFLPAVILSGFVFEIESMPALVRAFTYLIPARYYVNVMHTLFLSGTVWSVILFNSAFLLATACLFLGLTVKKTRLRLE